MTLNLYFPKELVNIIKEYAKDTTYYDNFNKVMKQLNKQSSVHDYGYYLTFYDYRECYFHTRFYSTLDNYSDWFSGHLGCSHDDESLMNCEGKIKFDNTDKPKRNKPKKKY